MDLADPPAADQLAAEAKIRHAPLLRAVLEDAARLAKDLQAGEILLDGQPERLFAVNVLLRPGRKDGDRHVPVVGRGDGHGVDVLPRQNVAEVGVGLALDQPGARLATIAVGVGHGDGLHPFALQKIVRQPPRAEADVPDRHPLAGGRRVGVAQRGRGDDVRGGDGDGPAF